MILETLVSLEPSESTRVGYWATHPYHRLNVKDYVDEFCGWQPMKELIELIPVGVQKSFFTSMFQTGGRALEVLLLKKNNFTVIPNEGIVVVKNMRLLKRYKKTDSYIDDEGHKRWHTARFKAFRKPFSIQLREPFTPILLRHLDSIKQPDAYLFPSPQGHSRRFNKAHPIINNIVPDVNGQVPYSPTWEYVNIRKINDLASEDLKERLGLMRPFMAYDPELKDKVKIADEIHLWLHWFRSQRASQLVADYNFDEMDLLGYFTWEDIKTALRYAKTGLKRLTEKQSKAQVSYT